ncbi:hypothetical protein QR680_003237 [Steinernema hermaphroditum]|uniref:GLTSCR protein conserved domain-containing protein n=1 Tax=Steinernema hermaphroditum TaxID=289476 RepID=A0AA39H831_9BILA|nr:hypothetical protein QR680_003237 [Steinernema hermaphroditum]
MSAGGIGKMDPEETDAPPEEDDPYWDYQFGGYGADPYNCSKSPVDYGGDLGMLGAENDINTLAVPLSPTLDSSSGPSYQQHQPPSQTHGQVNSHSQQQKFEYDMSMGQTQQQQQQQLQMQQAPQQQPMQASGMLQQQSVHMQPQHIQTAQPGPSQPQLIQQAPQQIFVQQQPGTVPASSYQYMSNGTTWSMPQQPGQLQQIPQQAVLVPQLNGSQYVLLNSTSGANVVASGAPIIQQQRTVTMSTTSVANVTSMSGGQPIVTSQMLNSDNSSVYSQDQIILPPGCMINPASNGRIQVQVASAPLNSQIVQQNHRVQSVQQPIMQQSSQPNLQQLLSTPSTSHTPVAPAPMPQQSTPASSTKKRPIRRKTPAVQNKKQNDQANAAAGGAVMEARMTGEDTLQIQQIMAELARLQQLDPQGQTYQDQINNLTQRRNEILMKMISGTSLQQPSQPEPSPAPPQPAPVQQQPQYQPQRQPSKRVSNHAQRPPAIRDPPPQNVYEPVYEQKSQPQLIHSSHPSTSFESSQSQQQVYVQSTDNFPSSQPTTVLQYASTSQMSASYQQVQVAPQGVGVVSSGHYASSNVVNSLSQPGGPVASCIITAQQQQEQQQRLLIPKPPAMSTPMKPPTAAAPQQPRPSPVPVIRLPPMKELSQKISHRKDARSRRISRYFELMKKSVEESAKADINTQFRDISDVCKRLLPFAIGAEPEISQKTIENFDHEHLRLSIHQNERKRRLEERLNAMYLKEAMTPVDNELIMLLSLDKEYEKRKLAEEKELVEKCKNGSSEDLWTNFVSKSEFRPFASEVNAALETNKTISIREELEKAKVNVYDYYEFNEDQYARSASPNAMFSTADEEEERSLRILHRKRTRKDLRNLKRAYLYSIADDFQASYKPPYYEMEPSYFEEPAPLTPASIKQEPTPVAVVMSPPLVDKKVASVLSPAAQSTLATPQRQSTPQLQTAQQIVPPVLPPQPVVPKIVIETPTTPTTPVEIERKPCVMDLKTKMKRYRLEQYAFAANATPEKVNNENVNNEHKVPPMKISRFNVDSIPSTSSTPVVSKSEIAISEEAPQPVQERKVQPLKLPLKLPSLKISIKKPVLEPPIENGMSHKELEIEERSGKKKRKEKDKKKKHKERDKKKHRDKSKEREQEAQIEPLKVIKMEMERMAQMKKDQLMEAKRLEIERAAHELQVQQKIDQENEVKKQQEKAIEKEKVKEKEKSKDKEKEKSKDKEKHKDKESKKEKKRKKKHRHEENAKNSLEQNGIHECPASSSLSVVIRPPKTEEASTVPSKIPKLKFKLPVPPPPTLSPELHNTPVAASASLEAKRPASSAGSSSERPNGVVEPLKLRFTRKFQSDTAAKAAAAESVVPVVTAPPPQRAPQPTPPPPVEEKKERKEKKEGGLKLTIKRLVPPTESAPIVPTPHRKERSSKKERSSSSSSKSASSAASNVENSKRSSSAIPPLAATTDPIKNNSSPFAAQEPPTVEQIRPPIRMRIKPPPAPPQSQSQNIEPTPIQAPVFTNPPLNLEDAPPSYSINSFLNTFSEFSKRFTPNCSDEESESDLRNRTDDLISRLTTNSKPCAQNSS